MTKLSRFQKNLNDFTFYLLMMSEKLSVSDLKLYDKNCPFVDNFEFLKKVETELSDLIDDDEMLLLNQSIPSGPLIKQLIYDKYDELLGKNKESRKRNKDKNIDKFLRDKYMDLSSDYPLSKIELLRYASRIMFFGLFLFTVIFVIGFQQIKQNLSVLMIFISILLFQLICLYFWISYSRTIKKKGPKCLQFRRKFSISFCYDKLCRSKEILEQILFENYPFERLEENRLYRKIIKISPKMKYVFKVMIEKSYWHYDGNIIIQTGKCTRQLIAKLAGDADLGINSDNSWHDICKTLMLLEEPLYNYQKGKDDVTWNEVKKLIIEELKKHPEFSPPTN